MTSETDLCFVGLKDHVSHPPTVTITGCHRHPSTERHLASVKLGKHLAVMTARQVKTKRTKVPHFPHA